MPPHAYMRGAYLSHELAMRAAGEEVEDLAMNVGRGTYHPDDDEQIRGGWLLARWRTLNGYLVKMRIHVHSLQPRDDITDASSPASVSSDSSFESASD